MNKKWILFYCLFHLVLISCEETEVENDIRVLVTGNITDQNTMPISNAHIEVYIDTNSSLTERILVGKGFSNNTGNFIITSLFGPNELFYVEISAGDQYATYRYQTNTQEFTPSDLRFDLETVQLARLATFNYDIIKTSTGNNTLAYSFRFIRPQCSQVFDEGELNETASQCYGTGQTSGQLSAISPNVEDREIKVPLGSQIEFIHRINEEESISEIIDVNTIDYAFQFNY